jgi:hypothetical protein
MKLGRYEVVVKGTLWNKKSDTFKWVLNVNALPETLAGMPVEIKLPEATIRV